MDALLEEQTRPHEDVDIVIQEKDVPKLRDFLENNGYTDIERDDSSAWNFVLGDEAGHIVDVHVIVFDDQGNGIHGPKENGIMYPAAALTGEGMINHHQLRCISPEWMVKFHSGYKLREVDYQGVSAICEKFDIDLPKEYQRFEI